MNFAQKISVAILAVIHLSSPGIFPAQADENDKNSRLAAAMEVMKASKAQKNVEAVLPLIFGQMRTMIKAAQPGKTAELDAIFDEVKKEMLGRLDEMLKLVAEVYARHFSTAELKAIVAFYNTPAGKKMADKLPLIARESMQIGQQWGQKLGIEAFKRVREKAKARGIEL